MPSRIMITPLTLLYKEPTLFDDLELPTINFADRGYDNLFLTPWELDRDVLIDNLLMETGELNVLYTNPSFMKWAIKQWSKKELPVWQQLFETMFFRYNPIWNKDGVIEHTASETETPGVTETEQKTYNLQDAAHHVIVNTGDTTTVLDGEQNTTDSVETDNTTTTDTSVSAYDTNSFQPRDKVVEVLDGDESRTGRTETDNTEIVTDNTQSARDGTDTRTGTETTSRSRAGTNGRISSTTDVEQGNIGVTSSQNLIEQERELVKFSIYDFIIQDFKARFCVLLY